MVNAILMALSILVLLPIVAFCSGVPGGAAAASGDDTAYSADQCRRDGRRPRAAVLIPAHNEQLVIEQTLSSVIPTLATGDRVLVVADNCDDQTAELARGAGAEVVVRNDPDHCGKGYALQSGLRALRHDPPEVVVVSMPTAWWSRRPSTSSAGWPESTQRPVQALNLTDRNPATGPIQAVSLLANRFTNLIRPLGIAPLGGAVPPDGHRHGHSLAAGQEHATGRRAASSRTCNWGSTWRCTGTCRCSAPRPASPAACRRRTARSSASASRWEHGHLRTAVTQIPRLLAAAMGRRSWPLLAMALDLSIPPLTLLVALWLAGAILGGLAWWLGASWLPMALLAGGGAALTAALGLGWAVFCRRQVPLRAVVAVPHYMLRKLPIYTRVPLPPTACLGPHRARLADGHDSPSRLRERAGGEVSSR